MPGSAYSRASTRLGLAFGFHSRWVTIYLNNSNPTTCRQLPRNSTLCWRRKAWRCRLARNARSIDSCRIVDDGPLVAASWGQGHFAPYLHTEWHRFLMMVNDYSRSEIKHLLRVYNKSIHDRQTDSMSLTDPVWDSTNQALDRDSSTKAVPIPRLLAMTPQQSLNEVSRIILGTVVVSTCLSHRTCSLGRCQHIGI